jgi:diguanylate cyclase (GGDEF)-like protein
MDVQMNELGSGRRGKRGRLPPPIPSGVSPEALAAVHRVTRALFAATSGAQIVELVCGFVRELGGDIIPASLDPADAVPIDLGLGEVEPLLPVAPEVSVARLQLESLLPSLMEDARAAVLRLRNSDRLADEASIDVLTGVLNRRALFRQLISLTVGDAVVMLDLDHFKQLNDTFGHDAGDVVLQAFGGLLRASVRAGDVVGRYGGEELLVGMVGATPAQAAARVAGIRGQWLARKSPVTFSAGVAAVRELGARAAVPVADRALYRAKAAGRDRCEVARDEEY